MLDLVKYYADGMNFPKEETEEKTTLSMTVGTRKNTITFYHIFPGIEVMYNNFNTRECLHPTYKEYSSNIIEINHCRNGRFGCIIDDKQYVSLGPREMEANILNVKRTNNEFPLGFYEGIGIFIDVPVAKEYLIDIFPEVAGQLDFLKGYLDKHDKAVFLKQVPELECIFSELYSVKTEIRQSYIKLKVLELLLAIQAVPIDQNMKESRYYSKEDVNKVKAIHELVTSNLEIKYTLEKLAKQYNISLTQLKNCFKEMYGMPFYTYLKHYKMHKAAHYLEETDLNINNIALKLGYENTSKFISAFKSILKYTPGEYRNKNVSLEHLNLFGVEIKE